MTKDKLKEYTNILKEIKIIEEKIEYLEEQKTSVKSQVITDMPQNTNSEKDRLGKLLGQLEELLEIYYEKKSRAMKTQLEIEEAVEKLDNAVERNIMRLRYIEDLKWEEVCVEMSYSWENIHRIHRNILNKIK